MKKPTRILSSPVKVMIDGFYNMQFETDCGLMTSTEIMWACSLTKNEFYHRGRRDHGKGWFMKDMLLPRKERKFQRERNAQTGRKKKFFFDKKLDLKQKEVDKEVRRAQFDARQREINREYRAALISAYRHGGMNRVCNGQSLDHMML
jgi:hypothetical protein